MIGPRVEGSAGAGLVVGEDVLGDAVALTTGWRVEGAGVDGSELGGALAVDAAADETTAALLTAAAAWCDPEHADNSRLATTAGAHQPDRRRRARWIGAAGIPHSPPSLKSCAFAALWRQ
jgi:hypothetical protein